MIEGEFTNKMANGSVIVIYSGANNDYIRYNGTMTNNTINGEGTFLTKRGIVINQFVYKGVVYPNKAFAKKVYVFNSNLENLNPKLTLTYQDDPF